MSERRLRENLRNLKGKIVWNTATGGGAGSILSLDCGEKIPNQNEKNKALKPFVGEFGIMIYSSWRVIEGKKILCSSQNENAEICAEYLTGKRITDIRLTAGLHDLVLFFDNIALQIFCDFAPDADWTYQWFFSQQKTYFCALTNGNLTVES